MKGETQSLRLNPAGICQPSTETGSPWTRGALSERSLSGGRAVLCTYRSFSPGLPPALSQTWTCQYASLILEFPVLIEETSIVSLQGTSDDYRREHLESTSHCKQPLLTTERRWRTRRKNNLAVGEGGLRHAQSPQDQHLCPSHLSSNGFLAGSTMALWHCWDPKVLQFLLQTPKH